MQFGPPRRITVAVFFFMLRLTPKSPRIDRYWFELSQTKEAFLEKIIKTITEYLLQNS
jgi:hypothetical protein